MSVREQSVPPTVAEALDRLGRLNLRDQTTESVLQTVVELARQVLPHHPEASITLLVGKRAATTASTGALATELDERQYLRGQGPCLHAATTGELVEITDMRSEARWPEYARAAWEQGSGCALSVPLPLDDDVRGALNVHARRPHALGQEAIAAARLFAPYAGVAVSNMRAYAGARDLAGNLQAALESRAVIDQAKGVLMERYRLTADQAFQALAGASMQRNVKVRQVADELVRTGEFTLPDVRRG